MKKVLLAIGSIAPTIIILISLLISIYLFFFVDINQEFDVMKLFADVIYFGVCAPGIILSGFMWGYIIHIIVYNNISVNKKVKWFFAILFLSLFTIPMYWYKYMRINNVEE